MAVIAPDQQELFDRSFYSRDSVREAAQLAVSSYADGISPPAGWVDIIGELSFPDGNANPSVASSSTGGMFGNFYVHNGSAARVLQKGDTAVLAFRGTDDVTADTVDYYLRWDKYYNDLKPLIDAFDAYVLRNADRITKTLVVGHSLGGTSVDGYMKTHNGPNIHGYTFNSPTAGKNTDPRLFHAGFKNDFVYKIVGDPAAANSLRNVSLVVDGPLISSAHANSFFMNTPPHSQRTPIDQIVESALYESIRPNDAVAVLYTQSPVIIDEKIKAFLTSSSEDSRFVIGTASKDDVIGSRMASKVDLGLGDDLYNSLADNDTIMAGGGHDTITGGLGANSIAGGEGNDDINASAGQDTVVGGMGNDHILGGEGNDSLHGGKGDDDVEGGQGADTLHGDDDNDVVRGGKGFDLIYGDAGADQLFGDLGDDRIFGGSENDVIKGAEGNDQLTGGPGNDLVFGGIGNDSLAGGLGSDTLYCGPGVDNLNGGEGNDLFVFNPDMFPGFAFDDMKTINAFESGKDRIDLSAWSGLPVIFVMVGQILTEEQMSIMQGPHIYIASGAANQEIAGMYLSDQVSVVNICPVSSLDFVSTNLIGVMGGLLSPSDVIF